MRKLTVLFALLIAVCGNAQDFKKLVLNVKGTIKQVPVFIEPIDNDRCLIVDYLRGSLGANGFKIVTERADASYIINMKYSHRKDSGCGGRVLKDLEGQIIDSKNNAEIVATFTFSQGSFEGKCASDIMSALAKKIKGEIRTK